MVQDRVSKPDSPPSTAYLRPLAVTSFLLVLVWAQFAVSGVFAEPCPGQKPCGGPTAWETSFDTFQLTVSGDKAGNYTAWRGQFSRDHLSAKIDTDRVEAAKRTQGAILVVSGRAMATKGLQLEPGSEIDALDELSLNLQLVGRLLDRAFPGGPGTLRGQHRLNLREEKTGIHVNTQSASGEFPAPWILTGTTAEAPTGAVEFALDLTCKGADRALRLSGSLAKAAVELSLDDSMPLAGWKIYLLGPRSVKRSGATIIDYGGEEKSSGYKTIADLRQELDAAQTEEAKVGTPDPAIDFTGFWKENCKEDFGLQIKHVGQAGMYSISFCGPGGCFDPGTYRPNTYINKDKNYEVIGPVEIRVRGSDGLSTYKKCQSDPNAVPKQ